MTFWRGFGGVRGVKCCAGSGLVLDDEFVVDNRFLGGDGFGVSAPPLLASGGTGESVLAAVDFGFSSISPILESSSSESMLRSSCCTSSMALSTPSGNQYSAHAHNVLPSGDNAKPPSL